MLRAEAQLGFAPREKETMAPEACLGMGTPSHALSALVILWDSESQDDIVRCNDYSNNRPRNKREELQSSHSLVAERMWELQGWAAFPGVLRAEVALLCVFGAP